MREIRYILRTTIIPEKKSRRKRSEPGEKKKQREGRAIAKWTRARPVSRVELFENIATIMPQDCLQERRTKDISAVSSLSQCHRSKYYPESVTIPTLLCEEPLEHVRHHGFSWQMMWLSLHCLFLDPYMGSYTSHCLSCASKLNVSKT